MLRLFIRDAVTGDFHIADEDGITTLCSKTFDTVTQTYEEDVSTVTCDACRPELA
jgi:hypothetical protein